jgi:replicative DNA helicase
MRTPDESSDRLLPHDIPAEQGVLGCIMECPKECLPEAVESLRAGHKVFYDFRHQVLYETFLAMFADGEAIDAITVQQRLKSKGLMESVGGLAYIMTLRDQIPSAVNLPCYLQIVLEKYQLRLLVQTCTRIVGRAFDCEDNPAGLLDNVERDILSIRGSSEPGRGVADLVAIHCEMIATYEAAMEGKQSGLLTGFRDLDDRTGGMQPQDMIVLAGQQSTGKTSLAMNIVWNVVCAGHKAGVLSFETSARKLIHRLYSAVGKVNGSRFLRASGLTEGELNSMIVASSRVLKFKDSILIDDDGGVTVESMKAKARRMRQRGADLLVIDYMQLLHAPGADGETARVTAISRGIKECAKENNIPVIAISSLNREAAKGERKPRPSDLRGSGQIEFDGNQIWLLDCEDTDAMVRTVRFKVAKNKDDGKGEFDLTFFASQFRFEDAAKVTPEDHPNYMKD